MSKYDEHYEEHYHCDLCGIPYRTKGEANKCWESHTPYEQVIDLLTDIEGSEPYYIHNRLKFLIDKYDLFTEIDNIQKRYDNMILEGRKCEQKWQEYKKGVENE